MKEQQYITKKYDVIIVGGGLAGICAAIASARHGAKTAIVQDRPVFGGNSSSEIRMHVAGATCHFGKKNNLETGILLELQLENKRRNPYHSFSVWDTILWEKVRYQDNLDSYLNTYMSDVKTKTDIIEYIVCQQMTMEKTYRFFAKIFVDATGDGQLGYKAGAECRYGSESRYEFHEPDAPEDPNVYTMGNSIMFTSKDMGEPVPFIKPAWAYTFEEKDLIYRGHGNMSMFHGENGITEEYCVDSGYWWIELGGNTGDIIGSAENIRDELYKVVYGIWDHIKNKGDHGAENYALDWIGSVMGVRESRRLVGDYLLNENDVLANAYYEDGVAYGGWPMDVHIPEGLFSTEPPTRFINFPYVYAIPYRCYYSKNINNLMMAGRNISTTKMALASTRVMGTCAIGGQAVGTAASMAVQYGCPPRMIRNHMRELQQQLLKDDCYIPGIQNEDENDLARKAVVTASTYTKGNHPKNVVSGIARVVEGNPNSNMWESDGIGSQGETLTLQWPKKECVTCVHLVFDTNLSQEIMISMTKTVQDRQPKYLPMELVDTYTVTLFDGGRQLCSRTVGDNYQRLNVVWFETEYLADRLEICVQKTRGLRHARIFEVRVY